MYSSAREGRCEPEERRFSRSRALRSLRKILAATVSKYDMYCQRRRCVSVFYFSQKDIRIKVYFQDKILALSLCGLIIEVRNEGYLCRLVQDRKNIPG